MTDAPPNPNLAGHLASSAQARPDRCALKLGDLAVT
jgi:hypothetical protein